MKHLYEKTYEREGNDSWLSDKILILKQASDTILLIHNKKWVGWGDDIIENSSTEINIDDIEEAQKAIDKYLDDNSLYYENDKDSIKIDLKTILEI